MAYHQNLGEPLKAGPRLTRVNDVCHCSRVCMSRSRWPNVRTCEREKKEKRCHSFVAILVHEKVSRWGIFHLLFSPSYSIVYHSSLIKKKNDTEEKIEHFVSSKRSLMGILSEYHSLFVKNILLFLSRSFIIKKKKILLRGILEQILNSSFLFGIIELNVNVPEEVKRNVLS